ncbi:MAG: hypothetical protein AAGE59_29990 [Cyanobacteria bacterium P01_F01_bin.86]
MKNTFESYPDTVVQPLGESTDVSVQAIPLSPPRRVELWSGRFAMVGFVATVAAIAFKATT